MCWPSHISAEDCQYVWAVVDIDFFVRFVSRAEIVAIFLSEKDPKLVPSVQRYIHHSTLRKNAAFPKIVVLIFFLFVQCSKNAGVDVSTVVNRRKAVSGQIKREGDCYLSQETVKRIELTSQWFPFWSHPMLLLPSTTHLQFRPNQLLKRETERPFEGIMIDHEQLSPLVRWRSLTLLSPHRE